MHAFRRGSQSVYAWEEAPCLSGFSPLCCQISRSMVQLFVYEGTIRGLHPWTRLRCTFPTEHCRFQSGILDWVKWSRSSPLEMYSLYGSPYRAFVSRPHVSDAQRGWAAPET